MGVRRESEGVRVSCGLPMCCVTTIYLGFECVEFQLSSKLTHHLFDCLRGVLLHYSFGRVRLQYIPDCPFRVLRTGAQPCQIEYTIEEARGNVKAHAPVVGAGFISVVYDS